MSRRPWIGILLCSLVAAAPAGSGSSDEPYQEVRVALASATDLPQLLGGWDLELMGLGDGDVRLLSRPSITDRLKAAGFRVEILHEDLERFYAGRQGKVDDYGVWHTYAETVAELNDLHDSYPDLTTAPFSLGQSAEGREIWAIKISDNPEVDEEEPEVLIDGVHHAREIMSLETCLHVARYLCQNHEDDPLAKRLVDGRQIFIVPIVNPDGFVYNETISPSGGGMWRRSRRDTGGRCLGVDLNRNYPFMWGQAGSSENSCDESYRGPAAASEPETQAMIRLMREHRFVTHESIHSVAGMILFPWGYTSEPTPDDAIFRSIAAARSRWNGYAIGQAPQLLYLVSGGSGDWAYGEQLEKPKIFSFTTEVGGSGFWPDPSEKDLLLELNLGSMLDLIDVAGPSLDILDLYSAGVDGGGRLEPGMAADLVARLQNTGLGVDARQVRMRLRCDDPYLLLLDAADTLGTVGLGAVAENLDHPFRCLVEEGCPQGRQVAFTLVVDAAGSFHAEVPFVLEVGQLPVIYQGDFEDAGQEWSIDDAQTTAIGGFVRVDPNPTTFQPGDDATPGAGTRAWITGQNVSEGEDDVDAGTVATRSPIFDLSATPLVRLAFRYFHGQRDGGDDPGGDGFAIDASADGGVEWINVIEIGDQASSPTWRSLASNLGDLIPLTDRVCFRVRVSDGPAESDIIEGGIDDFMLLREGTGSQPPGPPGIDFPQDGAVGLPPHVTLSVRNAEDPEGDPLRYGFRIFADPDLTSIVAQAEGVAEGTDSVTSWSPGAPLEPGIYYWRAYAADREQRGRYGAVASFEVAASLDPSERIRVHSAPNPAREGTRIVYFLEASGSSRVAIFDSAGRMVRRLPGVPSASGWQAVDWDGRDDDGRRVPSGSYWVRVRTPFETRTARVVRIE